METLACYVGSFNPFHIGHLNILSKAEDIFGKDNVIVAIGINISKNPGVITKTGGIPLNSKSEVISYNKVLAENRASELSQKIKRKVEVYFGFLHEFLNEKESQGYNVVLVRGLRNGHDLDYENNQLSFIKDFKPDIKSIFIMCDKEFEYVSSSSMRQLESFREGSSKKYLV